MAAHGRRRATTTHRAPCTTPPSPPRRSQPPPWPPQPPRCVRLARAPPLCLPLSAFSPAALPPCASDPLPARCRPPRAYHIRPTFPSTRWHRPRRPVLPPRCRLLPAGQFRPALLSLARRSRQLAATPRLENPLRRLTARISRTSSRSGTPTCVRGNPTPSKKSYGTARRTGSPCGRSCARNSSQNFVSSSPVLEQNSCWCFCISDESSRSP